MITDQSQREYLHQLLRGRISSGKSPKYYTGGLRQAVRNGGFGGSFWQTFVGSFLSNLEAALTTVQMLLKIAERSSKQLSFLTDKEAEKCALSH